MIIFVLLLAATVPIPQITYDPDAWVGKKITVCGYLGTDDPLLLYHWPARGFSSAVVVDRNLRRSKKSEGRTCISGWMQRKDGLTAAQAQERGIPYHVITEVGYNYDYLIGPRPKSK